MASYLGTKAVFLSTTAASVGGDATIGGDLTVDTNTLHVDSTNNRVGIGTSSVPAAARAMVSGGRFYVNSQDQYSVLLQNGGTSGGFIGTTGSDTINFFNSGGTERMRIDSSGNLLVGTTISPQFNKSSGDGFEVANYSELQIANSNNGLVLNRTNPLDGDVAKFFKQGTQVGGIAVTGSSTSYNTSSDYRLKTDAQPMTGAAARVQALNPVNFEWIADGTRVDGFLAHEAQEVVPEAVTGEKDAMRTEEYEVTPAVLDDDGNVVTEAVIGTREVPEYQGIDQSKLVPLLTAALQEALTKIDALETRITALEAV